MVGHSIANYDHPNKLSFNDSKQQLVWYKPSVTKVKKKQDIENVKYDLKERGRLENTNQNDTILDEVPWAVENEITTQVVNDVSNIPVWSSSQDEKIFVGRIEKSAKSLDHIMNMLDDSGCMGMVMSAIFAEKVGLETYRAESPTTVMFANLSTIHKLYGKDHIVDNLVGVVRLMAMKDITGIDEVFVVHIKEQLKAIRDFYELPYISINVTTVSEKPSGPGSSDVKEKLSPKIQELN
ncbi:hypothetical protein HK096_011129, partial [Nowakowskiella sp. JEL0078]